MKYLLLILSILILFSCSVKIGNNNNKTNGFYYSKSIKKEAKIEVDSENDTLLKYNTTTNIKSNQGKIKNNGTVDVKSNEKRKTKETLILKDSIH